MVVTISLRKIGKITSDLGDTIEFFRDRKLLKKEEFVAMKPAVKLRVSLQTDMNLSVNCA